MKSQVYLHFVNLVTASFLLLVGAMATSCSSQKRVRIEDYFEALSKQNVYVQNIYDMDSSVVNSLSSKGYTISNTLCQIHDFDLSSDEGREGKREFLEWIQDSASIFSFMEDALPIERYNLLAICGKGMREEDPMILRSWEILSQLH